MLAMLFPARLFAAEPVQGSVGTKRPTRDGEERCGTLPPPPAQQKRVAKEVLSFREVNGAALSDDFPTVEVQIWFHVIHTGSTGKVSAQQTEEQIDVLNAAYKDAPLHFSKGGSDEIESSKWFRMTFASEEERLAKAALQKDPAKFLNVYTADVTPLGWASFPWDRARTPENDGVVLRHTTLPGGAEDRYNRGATLVHEVGHWLGLYHTFQGGCVAPGDEVDDTPSQADGSNKYLCREDSDSCRAAGLDPVHNFMGYCEDSCLGQFTAGQLDRLRAQISLYRLSFLLNSKRSTSEQ
jgi:predicted Zn-dependent protease